MEEFNEPMKLVQLKLVLMPMRIVPGNHTHYLSNDSTTYYACKDKSNLVKALVLNINKLTWENKHLKHRSVMKTSLFTWRKINADSKMKFYNEIL